MKEIVKKLHDSRQIELAKRLLKSEGYSIRESIKSNKEYYRFLKAQLKEILGLNVTDFEDVSTRNPEYKQGYISVTINVAKKKYRESAYLVTTGKQNIKSFIPGAEVTDASRGIPIISISVEDIDALMAGESDNVPGEDTITFWCTSVDSMSETHYAYGARITDSDGFKFPTRSSIKRIQTKLGEKYFSQYYSISSNKNFRIYASMKSYLEKEGGTIPSEEEIIAAGYAESYFTF